MKSKEQLLKDVLKIAKENVSLPELLDFSIAKGEKLANYYKANKNLVIIGICLMDIKLKHAIELGKLQDHIKLAIEFAKELLNNYKLTNEEYDIIINCIEAHHGSVAFNSVEAEIVANADCYIFIHPKGIFNYIGLLVKRGKTFDEQIKQLKNKLEEKYAILSLEKAKDDLEGYYQTFKKLFDDMLSTCD